ncbi:hypothetical protein [Ramlibacter sp.]|uniref:hypothetical protein n=1 Tax=Ramlibacter sp. TaxID=1917967 RepID=UPI00182E4DBD|nr:hypothetical protein [Ramlibacter sp.]MBA2673970.1 hypothetical protein [Ramlibacter sp.]
MIDDEKKRLSFVRDLLEMTMPLEEIIWGLSALTWDYEGEGVEMTKKHLERVLQRYLRGEVGESDIELWANQVEGRDDVRLEDNAESLMGEILHELANPLLTQPLDRIRAAQLVRSLA